MSSRVLTSHECSYIQHELGVDSSRRKKLVLQRLCGLYARGFIMPAGARHALEQSLGGIITALGTDPKVRRWSLNTIALMGTRDAALTAVLYAVDNFQTDPEIFASAISALIRLDPDKFYGIASSANYSRELVLLSGLKIAGPEKVDVRDLRLNIDVAEPETLKLSLLAVGLDRAPPYMFHPGYDNGEIVKTLGGHDNQIVSQYSVWAIAENPNLGITNLGVPVNDMEALRPNVRGWVYRLYAEDKTGTPLQHDMVVQGSMDSEADVRLSLATGLKDTFYDGIEGVTISWFEDEQDQEVRSQLLDHIVRQADKFELYSGLAATLYAKEPSSSLVRQRMDAAASGKGIFANFQRIAFATNQPLFANYGDITLVSNEYKIQNVNSGAVSFGGTAINNGNVQNNLTPQQAIEAIAALDKIQDDLEALPLPENEKLELSKAIEEAKTEPSKDRLGSVVKALGKIEQGLNAVSNSGAHIAKIAGYVALLGVFL